MRMQSEIFFWFVQGDSQFLFDISKNNKSTYYKSNKMQHFLKYKDMINITNKSRGKALKPITYSLLKKSTKQSENSKKIN